MVEFFDAVKEWGETSVYAEGRIVDNCGDWEVGEKNLELFVNCRASKHTENLFLETVGCVNTFEFVIPAEEENLLGVHDGQSQKKANDFYGIFTSIDVIPEEEEAADFAPTDQDPKKIAKVSVDVSNNEDITCHRQNVWHLLESGNCNLEQFLDMLAGEGGEW